jgi:cytochrome c
MSAGYEFNKIAMAVLLVGTSTLGLSIIANDVIFKVEKPAKPGFAVVVPDAKAPAAAGAAPSAPARPMSEVMASATAEPGAQVFRQCASCHTIAKGGANGVGPNLWGVVERQKASNAGFNYSAAAKAKAADRWTFDALFAYIENPRGYLPGTSMSFAGIRSAEQRANLLAYLREQSDAPVAMPK